MDDKLISAVYNFPELYNITLPNYRCTESRANAWRNISMALGLSCEYLILFITTLLPVIICLAALGFEHQNDKNQLGYAFSRQRYPTNVLLAILKLVFYTTTSPQTGCSRARISGSGRRWVAVGRAAVHGPCRPCQFRQPRVRDGTVNGATCSACRAASPVQRSSWLRRKRGGCDSTTVTKIM